MNTKQQSAYAMHLRVLAFAKKNRPLLNGFIVLDNLINRLEDSLNRINALSQQQSTDTSGLSDKKANLRTSARQKGQEISQGILAYAKNSENEILDKVACYTQTELKRYSDNDLIMALSVIYTAAKQNQPALLNYGLSTEKIAVLKLAIEAYKISVGSPKDDSIARKLVTGKLSICLNENARIVKKIDLLMGTLKYTDPELYAEYKDNRKTFRRSRSLMAKVAVTDSCTAKGLAGVRILFILADVLKLDKKSASGGGLNVKSLEEGVYKVSFSKIGYISRQFTVSIPKSECTRISIALEKEK